MRYKGYTLTVTTPKDSDRQYRDPVFTVIEGGTFGSVVYQGTICESFMQQPALVRQRWLRLANGSTSR